MEDLLIIINNIRANKKESALAKITEKTNLRRDLNFDSFELAELTVNIEDKFGVDIFEDGSVETVGEILAKISK